MDKIYREYFAIDEAYFPQINNSSIDADPSIWTKTYPHETFVLMLKSMERVLARQEKRSLWVEGAYGTGKSQCVYTLKKILDAPAEEVRAYWEQYDALKKEKDLLEKFLGHKEKGIVTAYRYASGNITSPRELFLAIQESVGAALRERKLYCGENTLKESVIAWIDEPAQKAFFNALLQKPEWSIFAQRTADEVLHELRHASEVTELMHNLFRLAEKEGITAMSIDADRLIVWLKDVIDTNDVKIVLVWDEFSAYFRQNRNSLDEFQKIAELVNLKPFYLIVVTHETGQLFTENDKTWKVVSDRFVKAGIDLPDNIAFNLIAHAFNVKDAAKDEWSIIADDLNTRLHDSRRAVMKTAKIRSEATITGIMPIHPMTALLLKNISSAFKSNQRSMFDFIKSAPDENTKSFQWFIDTSTPSDDVPLLTVDMLWDFFYEKGKEYLTPDIRLILDVFPQQSNLSDEEKIVLKTILIMQAIDTRQSGLIDLFKATEQNLSYVFEGIPHLQDGACIGIAKGLVKRGVLIAAQTLNNKKVFTAAILAGDQGKIEDNKKKIHAASSTSKLVAEGELATVLALPPALRVRYEAETNTGKILALTHADFTRSMNILADKTFVWKCAAVIAFAKDEVEALAFRPIFQRAVKDSRHKNVVFIDALSTPLGHEAFEEYVNHAAMAQYYVGNNNAAAHASEAKAKQVLSQDWKERIYHGQFTLYTCDNPEGERVANAQGVANFMQTFALKKFPYIFDFARGLSETTLKLTSAKQAAQCGIEKKTKSVVVNVEKVTLADVWNVEKYWTHAEHASLPISIVKGRLEEIIKETFQKEGQISIGSIYDCLETEFGFSQSNLSAFLTGFLLKEYSGEPYRYSDSLGGHEPMSVDKLKEMIGNYIGKNPKPTYILEKKPEEISFYAVTEYAWGLTKNAYSSTSKAASAVATKMRHLGLPIWALAAVDDDGVYGIVHKYIELVQSEGAEAHKKALEIGTAALINTDISAHLAALITVENCQRGMRTFLQAFEGGCLPILAKEIGAEDNMLSDIRRLFSVEYSCLWKKDVGEGEIKKLFVEYGIVKALNQLLHASCTNLNSALNTLREKLNFFAISADALQLTCPQLKITILSFVKIYKGEDILPEQRQELLDNLKQHHDMLYDIFENEKEIFQKTYAVYVEGLSESDLDEVRSTLPTGIFHDSTTISNAKVKAAAEEFRKKQIKTELLDLWKRKTETKSPQEWSRIHRTPILCCVTEDEYEMARKAFDTLNSTKPTDTEIKIALDFLKQAQFFLVTSDKSLRNASFSKNIIGEYATLLHDIEKVRDALESLQLDVYNWNGHPAVINKIRTLAEAEYNAGGSDAVLSRIDAMDDAQLKQYLKTRVSDIITLKF